MQPTQSLLEKVGPVMTTADVMNSPKDAAKLESDFIISLMVLHNLEEIGIEKFVPVRSNTADVEGVTAEAQRIADRRGVPVLLCDLAFRKLVMPQECP